MDVRGVNISRNNECLGPRLAATRYQTVPWRRAVRLAARALGEACGRSAGRAGDVGDGCGRLRTAGAGVLRGWVRPGPVCERCRACGQCGRGAARWAAWMREGRADGVRFPGRASPADPSDQRPLAIYKPGWVWCSRGRRVRALRWSSPRHDG
jgi:hypothetical protein